MSHRARARLALRVIWTGVVLIAVGLLVALVLASIRLNDQNTDLTERADESDAERAAIEDQLDEQAAAAEALEQQLRQLGEEPVVVPDRVPDAPALIPGPRGASCIEEVGYARCRGVRGTAGKDGVDGADSTVPGPAGREGPPGPAGPSGPAGKDGADGAAGKDGAPGTAKPGTYTCPDGEVQQGFIVDTDGTVTLACVRSHGNARAPDPLSGAGALIYPR